MANLIHTNNWKSRNFLVIVLFLQLTIYVLVFLNIPIARQVIGFLYLTFIPGIILLRILRLDKLDVTERVLFSVGLSIAFLMFVGLLINELVPLIGVSKPLSIVPLMTILNGVILLLCFLSYIKDKDLRFSVAENGKLSLFTLLLLCLPLLSVVGAISVNTLGNNFILLLMIMMISGLVILIILSEKLFPSKYYPLAVFMIAIALLFHASLISNYIYGHDIHFEYHIFRSTQNDSHWNSTVPYTGIPAYTSFNAMLSVTVLPTIYSNVLNMEATWILKIIYPLIFSFVPLGLYQLFKMQVGKKFAFASTFFFMANSVFFTELLTLSRQMVAELFYVLLFLVLLNKKMNPLNKRICFIIFSFALVVSHYSIAYIFMFLIFFAWLPSFFRKNEAKGITISSVALFFAILFSWYIYISASGAFNQFLSVGEYISRTFFTDFFNPRSRGGDVLRGIGMEAAPSFGHLMSRIFAYATEFFIIVGFVTLIIRRKKTMFDREYITISSLSMVLLVMAIALPNFAGSLNMTRFYHIQLLFLAPFFILGGETIFRFILNLTPTKTQLSTALLLIVLVPFFLFQTGFVYETTRDDSWSIPLSEYRMDAIRSRLLGWIYEQDVFGAKWLSRNIEAGYAPIYADGTSVHFELTSYGMLSIDRLVELSNTTDEHAKGVVYLGRINVINGTIIKYGTAGVKLWNITEISPILNNLNKVYSNGGCEIYEGTP